MPFQVVQLYPHDRTGAYQPQFFHRVASAGRILEDDPEWRAPTLDVMHPDFPRVAVACDVLVLHTLNGAEIEAVIRLRRELGKPTVYEVPDNYLALSGYIPDNHIGLSPLVRQRMLYYAWLCDALQVSSAGLAELFGRVNPRTVVMENHVPIPSSLPPKPEGFVFGWAGTRQHQPDLELIVPGVAAFLRRHPDAVFAYKGHLDVFEACFGDLPPAQTRAEPFETYAEFQAFLETLHVGLAPVRDTPVNRCRTDVKFVEYAAHGVAAVLADAPIYRPHADRARLFGSPEELSAILGQLYDDPAQVAGLAQRGHAWAKAERSRTALADKRRRFYRSLVGPGATPANIDMPPDCAEMCGQLGDAWTAHVKEEFETSLALCRTLLDMRSDYHQAQRLEALNLVALGRETEALDFLDGLDVDPVFQDVIAETQVLIAQRVRPAETDRYLQRIRSPLVRLRGQAGSATDKLAFYRGVLRLQPFDYFALMTVNRLLMRQQPDDPELLQLQERACLVAPDTVPREWVPEGLAPLLTTS